MAYQRTLYPEWSWSQSRQNLFEECPRKYYYHYYGSHNGWERDAALDAQKAYRFKQMKNLYLVFGEALHNMAELVINQWVQHGRQMTQEELLERVRNILNQAFRDSKHRDEWWAMPKRRVMLGEMYYQGALPPNTTDIIKQRIPVCVTNFLQSYSLREFIDNPAAKLVELERLNTIDHEGTKVYVKLDMLYRLGDKWIIVDWKTGREDERIEHQLKLYALYVSQQYDVPLEQIELRTEYLLANECVVDVILEKDLHQSLHQITEGIDHMRSCLADPGTNEPLPVADFAPTDDPANCRWCNFREICDVKHSQ